MSDDRPKPGQGRPLRPDEIELWRAITDDVVTLSGRIPARGKVSDSVSSDDVRAMRQFDVPQTPRPRSSVDSSTRNGDTSNRRDGKPPALGSFDNKKVRQISKGHVAIDDVLDLHGFRQSEAHGALKRFLVMAQARGARYVTVITGKGTVLPDDENSSWQGAGRERGVLRRVVRTWLEEPEFRSLVVSFTTASRGHGGDGALFVHVRRANRPSMPNPARSRE